MSPAMALFYSSPFLRPPSYRHSVSHCLSGRSSVLTRKAGFVHQHTRPSLSCSISMTDGESDNQGQLSLDEIKDKSREIWNSFPKPVKSFPWNKVLDNFVQLLLDVTVSVIKFLSAPVLAVSSLSEMSYCAHERKIFLVPIPLIFGLAVAGILKETAQEVSPSINDSKTPWHLIAIAVLLAFLKLPGPYYPYWARIIIPHFANGGLLRVLVMMYLWYQRPKKSQLLQNLDSSEQILV